MIRKFLLALAALAAAPAAAETLPVSGVYPAGSDAAAALQSIAIEPFGGVEGQALAIALGDELRGVAIDGKPYFRIVSASGSAEATLQGALSVETFRRDSYDKEREVCVERDEDDDCIKREKEKIPCWEAVVRLDSRIRLIDESGALLDAVDGPRERATRWCRDEQRPSQDEAIRQLTDELARDVRHRFAPVQRLEDIRVMEERDGLARADRDPFRNAIRLTKQDPSLACDAFGALEASNTAHASVLFNIGLCVESRGELQAADDYYRRALSANAKADYAGAGLRRIGERRRADAQLAAHDAP